MNGAKDYFSSRDEDDVAEAVDNDAVALSHVGEAAHSILRRKHGQTRRVQWNVTTGMIVGGNNPQQTPMGSFSRVCDFKDGHDDWFPHKMAEIVARTEVWCDILSLGPPDGLFLEELTKALAIVAETAAGRDDNPITVRMMFGNIPGMHVNCPTVLKALTANLPDDAPNLHIWVGAWRKGVSWNHAKIIAVDGRYLHTGGHNLWTEHYLGTNPVHDLSVEMTGRVAHDGHLFANEHWAYIQHRQSTRRGKVFDKMPDVVPRMKRSRATVAEWPSDVAPEYPPSYRMRLVPLLFRVERPVMVLSLGRLGVLHDRMTPSGARPSDDAFLAMFDAARSTIRLAQQDLGPVCVPRTHIAVPGCVWPKAYLSAFGRAMYERNVTVEMVLSNPGSVPGHLGITEAQYGNGWSCVDVAAEVIKAIKKDYGAEVSERRLRQISEENLRICFIRQKRGNRYDNGKTIGLHAKHFIIDDQACYIGSQNLYVCDLAEWGLLIDSEEETKAIMNEYWIPLWEASYTGEDMNVEEVMEALDIDRDGDDPNNISNDTRASMRMSGIEGDDLAKYLASLKPAEDNDTYESD